MYSNRFRALAAVVGILFAGHCLAQDLDLSFDGSCDGSLTAEAGSVQATSLDCVLTTSNNPTEGGVQAWSISVAAEGATITNITTDGTSGAEVADGGLRNMGFEKSETTDDSGAAAGGNNNCEGLSGAVSAVVLSFESPVTLEIEGSAVIARVDIEAGAPDGPGDCSTVNVFYADGCRGSGQPVRNSVTLNTATFIPEIGNCSFDVCSAQVEDCDSEGDEDENGLADCADPACAENAACIDDGNGDDDDGNDGDDDDGDDDGDDDDGDDGDDDGDDGGDGEEGENAPPGFAFGRSELSPPEDAENEDASGSVRLVQVRSRASMHIHIAGLEPGAAYNVDASLNGASENIGTITTREATVRPSRCYSGGLSVPEEEEEEEPADEGPAEEGVEGAGAGDEEVEDNDDEADDDEADDEEADDDEADDDEADDDDDRRGWRWGWGWRNRHNRRESGPSGSARINLNRSRSEASYRVTVRRLEDPIASVRLILNDGTAIELDGRRGRIELAEGQVEALNGAVVEVYTAADEGAEATLALSGDVNSCYPFFDRMRARIAERRAGKGSLRIDTRRDDELPLGAAEATDLEGAVITVTSEDGAVVLSGTIDELRTFGRDDEEDDDEALEVVDEIAEEGGGAAFKLLEPHDASFVRGDANDDGVVNLSDPIRILSMLFQGGGNLYCEDSADANDDGEINLTDPILILRTLFDGNVGGISAPYPYRGFDPTSDEMHCKDFEG